MRVRASRACSSLWAAALPHRRLSCELWKDAEFHEHFGWSAHPDVPEVSWGRSGRDGTSGRRHGSELGRPGWQLDPCLHFWVLD